MKDCFVDEAILLAETIAAVDESKNPDKAEEVTTIIEFMFTML